MLFTAATTWVDEIVRSQSVNWKLVLYTGVALKSGFSIFTDILEYRVQCRDKLSSAIAQECDDDEKETFHKSQDYAKANLRLSLVTKFFDVVQGVALVHYDVVPQVWYFWNGFVGKHFPARLGDATTGILAVLSLGGLDSVLSIPFSLYDTFVIQERFGFNKMGLGLFFKDIVKTWVISLILLPAVLAPTQKIIEYFGPKSFAHYLIILMVAFNILLMYLAPAVILPWFNKFEPLEDGELKVEIEKLARSKNFPLTRIYVSDSSTRSSHSNAYFIGLYCYKQIVLFDTLLKDQTTDQIIAILAHELGHWSHSHTVILLGMGVFEMVLNLPLLAFLLDNKHFFASLGFTRGAEMPILVAMLFLGDVIAPLSIFTGFFSNFVTRLLEYDADNFAVDLGCGASLTRALKSLSKSNLSTIESDPLYSTFHHSHPKLFERICAIKSAMKKKQ